MLPSLSRSLSLHHIATSKPKWSGGHDNVRRASTKDFAVLRRRRERLVYICKLKGTQIRRFEKYSSIPVLLQVYLSAIELPQPGLCVQIGSAAAYARSRVTRQLSTSKGSSCQNKFLSEREQCATPAITESRFQARQNSAPHIKRRAGCGCGSAVCSLITTQGCGLSEDQDRLNSPRNYRNEICLIICASTCTAFNFHLMTLRDFVTCADISLDFSPPGRPINGVERRPC